MTLIIFQNQKRNVPLGKAGKSPVIFLRKAGYEEESSHFIGGRY